MPRYRMVADQTTLIETFDAVSDAQADRRGRELSLGFQRLDSRFGATCCLRVERHEGADWVCVYAWAPER